MWDYLPTPFVYIAAAATKSQKLKKRRLISNRKKTSNWTVKTKHNQKEEIQFTLKWPNFTWQIHTFPDDIFNWIAINATWNSRQCLLKSADEFFFFVRLAKVTFAFGIESQLSVLSFKKLPKVYRCESLFLCIDFQWLLAVVVTSNISK